MITFFFFLITGNLNSPSRWGDSEFLAVWLGGVKAGEKQKSMPALTVTFITHLTRLTSPQRPVWNTVRGPVRVRARQWLSAGPSSPKVTRRQSSRGRDVREPFAIVSSFLRSSCLFGGRWICFIEMNHSECRAGAERAADQIESEREWGGGEKKKRKKRSPRFPLTSNTCTVGANQPPILYTNFNGLRRGERKLAYQGGAAEHPTSSQAFHLERRGINPPGSYTEARRFHLAHSKAFHTPLQKKSVQASSGLSVLERRQKPACNIVIPLTPRQGVLCVAKIMSEVNSDRKQVKLSEPTGILHSSLI